MKSSRFLALGCCIAMALSGCGGSSDNSSSEAVYGITATNDLVKFELDSPGTIDLSVPITGLQGGESILAIDFRATDGNLYALGSTSRLYTINLVTAVATQVGAGTFATALSGSDFGMDFNEVVDRIRVVSDAEQNIRLNPTNATVAGVDVNLNPAGNVVACAYVPPSSAATTLFAIDSGSDQLVRIGDVNGTPQSPNSGVITNIGPLGVAVGNAAGFDIDSDNLAVMSVNVVAGTTNLYSVNLATGAATLMGVVGNNLDVVAIAIKE